MDEVITASAEPIYTTPPVEAVTVELQAQLMTIRREAISLIRKVEEVLQLPPEQRTMTRAERRAEMMIERGGE